MNQQLALEVLTICSEEQETSALSLLLLLTVSLVVVVIRRSSFLAGKCSIYDSLYSTCEDSFASPSRHSKDP